MPVVFRIATGCEGSAAGHPSLLVGDTDADLIGDLLELPCRDTMSGQVRAVDLGARIRRLLWPERLEWLKDSCRSRAAAGNGAYIARVLVELRFLCDSTTALKGLHVMIEYAPSTPSGIDWTALAPRTGAS